MRISDWSSDVCSSDLAEAAPADVGAVGTDLPAGDAPAPPPPGGWYADRIYPADAMEHSRHAMMAENGAQRVGFVSLNLAEYQARKGRDGFRWEGEAWYGGDIKIGRASSRERVCQYVSISVVAGSLKKKNSNGKTMTQCTQGKRNQIG